MQPLFLCKTQDGINVFFDPIDSHAATHFHDMPKLQELVVEMLSKRIVDNEQLGFDVDMQRTIGTTDVIEVRPGDEVVYAKRKNRDEYVPFVKDRQPEPSRYVSINLERQGNDYMLQSAWIGRFDSPPFPGEPNATPGSIPFWDSHAFVWGSQEIDHSSITNLKPWL